MIDVGSKMERFGKCVKTWVKAEKENWQNYLYKDLVGHDQFIDIVLEEIDNFCVDNAHGCRSMFAIRQLKRDAS